MAQNGEAEMKGLLPGLLAGFGLLLAGAVISCARPAPVPAPPVPAPAPAPSPAPSAPEPAKFTASSLTISPPRAGIDEPVTIDVMVANTGGRSGSHIVTLNIDGLKAAAKEITLAGGASEKVSFTVRKYVARDYAVNVDGQPGMFTVRAPAKFIIPRISVFPGKAEPGEDVTVSAIVTNNGGSEGIYNIVFKVNGTEESQKQVKLTSGASENVSYTLKKTVMGDYNVDVNGTVVQFAVARRLIKDLAYIKAYGVPYSDDSDADWEGVSISIGYFTANGEGIQFKDVSVNTTALLYWYTGAGPIFQREVKVYSSEVSEGEVMKIPFAVVPKRPDALPKEQKPLLEVVVTTPTQGNFADRNGHLQYWP